MKCRELSGFVEACLDAYIDGELDDRECGELEAHLSECEHCRTAVRSQARLKALVRTRAAATSAPEHLLSKLSACLDQADREEGTLQVPRRSKRLIADGGSTIAAAVSGGGPGWRVVPVFASVAFLLVFVWVSSGGFAHEPLVDDAIRKHSRALPLEVTGPAKSLQGWLRDKMDFDPNVPIFASGLDPLGARLSHIRDHPAAYIGYGLAGSGPDGERMASLFIFSDPSFDPSIERHRSRRIGENNVIVTNRSGFNVVLWTDGEIVYSLVSDLEERELLSLVATAIR